jgi:protocatechuate 3,4-dioxygenase beta subunit
MTLELLEDHSVKKLASRYHDRDLTIQPVRRDPLYASTVLRSPAHPLLAVGETIADLSGPVFGHLKLGPLDNDLIRNFASGGLALGERIIIHGTVQDQNGRPVPETLIEIWQANAGGRYRHVRDGYLAPLDPNFSGCGRCLTDRDGRYTFKTVRPGPYPFKNGGCAWRPSHIHFSVFGATFTQRLVTQAYFEGDPLIPLCPIANTVKDPRALRTLIATLDMSAAVEFDALAYRFDIVLRGQHATFFENRTERV